MTTLVLTGTIAPSKNVISTPNGKYTSTSLNPKKREKEYYEAIKYYLEKSNFDTIIFCDNSNYDFSYAEDLQNIAKSLEKTLELLKFQGDVGLSTNIGFGAGEAEILDYIYENSKIIHNTTSRFKITGRYIISNINDIIKELKENECYFQRFFLKPYPFNVVTAFFKVSNIVYEQYLYKKVLAKFILRFNEKKKYKKADFMLESIFYICLRRYLLSICHSKNICISYKNKRFVNEKFYSIFRKTGLMDFNRTNKVLDSLFYKNLIKE